MEKNLPIELAKDNDKNPLWYPRGSIPKNVWLTKNARYRRETGTMRRIQNPDDFFVLTYVPSMTIYFLNDTDLKSR